MIPRREPTAMPPLFQDWEEWRDTYSAHVNEYRASRKGKADETYLSIRLMRLGFVGAILDAEMEYIKENA